jgi:hypothetical protein
MGDSVALQQRAPPRLEVIPTVGALALGYTDQIHSMRIEYREARRNPSFSAQERRTSVFLKGVAPLLFTSQGESDAARSLGYIADIFGGDSWSGRNSFTVGSCHQCPVSRLGPADA